jgi:putative ABC transport system permease protein
VLVASQFAVAVPLLIGAGLLLTSFTNLQRVDTGVDQENLLTMRITLPRSAYTNPEAVKAFWDEVTPRVEAIPGVVAVGRGTGRPPQDIGMTNNFNLEDDPTPPDRAEPVVPWPVVSPNYFRTLAVPIIRGRVFDERDRMGAPQVAVVDQSWVRTFSSGKDPIGRRFYAGGCNRPDCPLTTVIGVVGDVKYLGLDTPAQGTIYRPLAQATWWAQILFVRTTGDPYSVFPVIRDIVRESDPALPVSFAATMDELMQVALSSPRNLLGLIAAFAAVALLLAAIGIHGVMSYFVQQHTRDIGIRMALGGSRGAVLRLVVGQGMRLVLLGVAVGIGGALALTRLLSGMLFEVSPTDTTAFVCVTAGLVATALVACVVPAGRAAGVDPAATLRQE